MDIDFMAIQGLAENGPLIDATVDGHIVRALVDTGAAVTCIRSDLAASLGLKQKGNEQWHDAHHDKFFPVYETDLEIFGQLFSSHEINAYPIDPRKPFAMLLGRDILVSFVLEYDGPRGTFSLR